MGTFYNQILNLNYKKKIPKNQPSEMSANQMAYEAEKQVRELIQSQQQPLSKEQTKLSHETIIKLLLEADYNKSSISDIVYDLRENTNHTRNNDFLTKMS